MTSYARGIHRCETAPQWMRGVTRAANRQPIGLTARPRVCETYILDGGWNVTPVVGPQGHKVRCAGPLLRQNLCAGVLCGFCAGNGLNPAKESKTTFRA